MADTTMSQRILVFLSCAHLVVGCSPFPRPDDIIIRSGTISNQMYFIKDGEILMERHGVLIMELSDGEFFGESSLLSSKPSTANFIAQSFCDLFTLTRHHYEQVIEYYPKYRQLLVWKMNAINAQKRKLVQAVQTGTAKQDAPATANVMSEFKPTSPPHPSSPGSEPSPQFATRRNSDSHVHLTNGLSGGGVGSGAAGASNTISNMGSRRKSVSGTGTRGTPLLVPAQPYHTMDIPSPLGHGAEGFNKNRRGSFQQHRTELERKRASLLSEHDGQPGSPTTQLAMRVVIGQEQMQAKHLLAAHTSSHSPPPRTPSPSTPASPQTVIPPTFPASPSSPIASSASSAIVDDDHAPVLRVHAGRQIAEAYVPHVRRLEIDVIVPSFRFSSAGGRLLPSPTTYKSSLVQLEEFKDPHTQLTPGGSLALQSSASGLTIPAATRSHRLSPKVGFQATPESFLTPEPLSNDNNYPAIIFTPMPHSLPPTPHHGPPTPSSGAGSQPLMSPVSDTEGTKLGYARSVNGYHAPTIAALPATSQQDRPVLPLLKTHSSDGSNNSGSLPSPSQTSQINTILFPESGDGILHVRQPSDGAGSTPSYLPSPSASRSWNLSGGGGGEAEPSPTASSWPPRDPDIDDSIQIQLAKTNYMGLTMEQKVAVAGPTSPSIAAIPHGVTPLDGNASPLGMSLISPTPLFNAIRTGTTHIGSAPAAGRRQSLAGLPEGAEHSEDTVITVTDSQQHREESKSQDITLDISVESPTLRSALMEVEPARLMIHRAVHADLSDAVQQQPELSTSIDIEPPRLLIHASPRKRLPPVPAFDLDDQPPSLHRSSSMPHLSSASDRAVPDFMNDPLLRSALGLASPPEAAKVHDATHEMVRPVGRPPALVSHDSSTTPSATPQGSPSLVPPPPPTFKVAPQRRRAKSHDFSNMGMENDLQRLLATTARRVAQHLRKPSRAPQMPPAEVLAAAAAAAAAARPVRPPSAMAAGRPNGRMARHGSIVDRSEVPEVRPTIFADHRNRRHSFNAGVFNSKPEGETTEQTFKSVFDF